LQVHVGGRGGEDDWVDVAVPPNGICLIVGSTLEHATGGALKAVEHRVVSPPNYEEGLCNDED